MNDIRDEDSQIEALKRWWEENGRFTVIGIVLALALVFGWQGWSRQQDSRAAEAATLYQNLLDADRGASASADRRATARHLANSLREDYSRLVYGQFGALYQAKYAAAEDDWEAAEEALRWILTRKPDAMIELQTRVRLGHVLLAQERYEDAQQVLSGTEAGSYAALIAELRGDIFLAQGETEKALAAYQQAKQELARLDNVSSNPLLEIKIRDLQPAPAVTYSEAAPEQAEDAAGDDQQ